MKVDAEKVSVLLRRAGLDPAGWEASELTHNRWLTPGVWRLERGGRRLVLKWLSSRRDQGATPFESHWTANSLASTRWNYWPREALAYLHGVVNCFSRYGLAAPGCVAVDVRDEDAVLVLDFVDGRPGEAWTIADYADAAGALGRGQAPYLSGEAIPPFEWLSARFLREYSSEKPVDWALLEGDGAWGYPMVRDHFPSELRPAAIELHQQRDRLYGINEALPQTLCHLDFWSKNLVRRSDGVAVLVDWAFVGRGAVGEDIGNLVPDAAFDHYIPSSELSSLEQAVFDTYVTGLKEGGWDDDPRIVQLGMWSSAVKYDWLTPAMLASASAPRHMRYGGTEEVDATYRFHERGAALLFNAGRARKALDLADRLGY